MSEEFEVTENAVDEQVQTGTNLSGKNKWDKQQRQAMYFVVVVFIAAFGMILLTKDEESSDVKASSVPQAPTDITKVVPGDELPPAAQKRIDEDNKRRAAAAAEQNSSVMDSAPPINKDKPVATPKSEDMPPASTSNGGHTQHVASFDAKRAEDKLKAMLELQKRWQTPNTIKFIPLEENKTQAAASHTAQLQLQATQAASQQQQPPAKPEAKGNHIPAGATFYAQWDKAMNSDAGGGMAIATIHGGELDGARVMGKHERKDSQLLVHFTLMTFNGNSIAIDAVAVNAETTADSVATEIDNHTFSRWLALAGASFLEGAANMAERSGQTMASTFGGPVTVATNYNTKQLIAGSVGNLGRRGATIAGTYFNTPPTLTTEQGDELSVIFATQTEDYTWLPKTTGF